MTCCVCIYVIWSREHPWNILISSTNLLEQRFLYRDNLLSLASSSIRNTMLSTIFIYGNGSYILENQVLSLIDCLKAVLEDFCLQGEYPGYLKKRKKRTSLINDNQQLCCLCISRCRNFVSAFFCIVNVPLWSCWSGLVINFPNLNSDFLGKCDNFTLDRLCGSTVSYALWVGNTVPFLFTDIYPYMVMVWVWQHVLWLWLVTSHCVWPLWQCCVFIYGVGSGDDVFFMDFSLMIELR